MSVIRGEFNETARTVREYRGQENYGNRISLLRTEEWIAAKQYSYSLGVSFRQQCHREGYGMSAAE